MIHDCAWEGRTEVRPYVKTDGDGGGAFATRVTLRCEIESLIESGSNQKPASDD